MKKLIVFICLLQALNVFAQDERAQLLVEQGRYNAASAVYKKLLTDDAKNKASYLYYLGDICWRKDKADSAKYFFMEGIKFDETNVLNYVGVGKVLMKSNPTEGKKSFEKAVTMTAGKNAQVYSSIAEYYILFGKKEEMSLAIENINKAIAIDSKNSLYPILLGDAQGRSGDGSSQASSYSKSSQLAKVNVPLLKLRYGQLYMKARNYELAVKYFDEGLAIDSLYAPIYAEKGAIYAKAKLYDESIKNYKKFFSIADYNSAEGFKYAELLYRAKKYSDALSFISVAQQKNNDKNPYLNRIKALCEFESGKYPEAKVDYELLFAQLQEREIIAMDNEFYGKTLLKLNDQENGLKQLTLAYEKDASKSYLLTDIASAYLQKEDYAKALQYLNLQYKVDTTDANVLLSIAKVYVFDKKYIQADSVLNKYIAMKPNSYSGYYYKGTALSQIESNIQEGRAVDSYLKTIELCAPKSEKYKNELKDAYSYLGYYYMTKNDKVKAKEYWNKVLQLDPNNVDAKKYAQMK
jgi:tetratricopeptide (TPR) repeat protein